MALGLTIEQIIDKKTHPLLEISDRWLRVKVESLATVQNGYAFKSKYFNHTEGVPLIRIRDIKSTTTENLYSGEFQDEFVVRRNDILIGMDGDFNASKWPGERGLLNQRVCRIKFDSNYYDKNFFFYCLQPYLNAIHQETSAVTVKHLSSKTIKSILLPLPPLPEQRAIVAKIEELFSSLDNGIANLKKAQEQLKVYRLTLLSDSLKSDKSIEIRYFVDDLSQGWSPKCLNQVSEDEKEWAVIKTSAVQPNSFIEHENKILPDSLEPREQHEIKENDILITRAGPRVRVGVTCLVPKVRRRLINCDKVYRIKVDKEKISPQFFVYLLNAPEQLHKVEMIKSGSSDSGLNLTQTRFLSLEVPFHDIQDQSRIVQEIESRLSVCDKVEESIVVSLKKAEALKQSILKKAFDGALLSEVELEACRQEADWEPAEVLLAKIKDQQAVAPTTKKQAKKKTKTKATPKPISETDLHAAIICKVIKAHEATDQLDKLGHVKCEKIVHFAEYHLGLSVGRKPVKDAAGPDDYPHLKKVESRAKKAGFFYMDKRDIGYSYNSGTQTDKLISKLEDKVDRKLLDQLDTIIQLFLPFDKVTAEIPATLYAGWNNLLLQGQSPTDDEIIYESRENWSESKLKIPRERFTNGLAWLRKHKLVPTGTGLLVDKRKK